MKNVICYCYATSKKCKLQNLVSKAKAIKFKTQYRLAVGSAQRRAVVGEPRTNERISSNGNMGKKPS